MILSKIVNDLQTGHKAFSGLHIYTQTNVKQQWTCFKHKKIVCNKIFEIQVLWSSFGFIWIEYQCNCVRSLKTGLSCRRVCFFTEWVWHFVMGSISNFRSCDCRKATDSYFGKIPERRCVNERTHFVKYRSNIWHYLFNIMHVKKRLTNETGSVA